MRSKTTIINLLRNIRSMVLYIRVHFRVEGTLILNSRIGVGVKSECISEKYTIG